MDVKALLPIFLLFLSNIFMTFAWYGHLKFKQVGLIPVIFASWGIAFFEYCIQVPANRFGSIYFTPPQLKILQEVITLIVFIGFSIFYLKHYPNINDYLAMLLVLIAIVVALYKPIS